MTKEAIFNKHISTESNITSFCYLNAMDEYAKQQAIAFQVWVSDNYKEIVPKYSHHEYIENKVYYTHEDLLNGKRYTPEQLYDIFLKQNK